MLMLWKALMSNVEEQIWNKAIEFKFNSSPYWLCGYVDFCISNVTTCNIRKKYHILGVYLWIMSKKIFWICFRYFSILHGIFSMTQEERFLVLLLLLFIFRWLCYCCGSYYDYLQSDERMPAVFFSTFRI